MPAFMLDTAAICLAVTALLAYVNHRFVGLPTTVGVMAIALVLSLAILGLDAAGLADTPRAMGQAFMRSIDFSEVLSLPASPARDTVLALTYCVVVVSILVQGLTIGRVIRALPRP